MKCKEISELMPDLAAGMSTAGPEVQSHIQSCEMCAGKLEEFRQMMALLDQWGSPEPSPYFDVRMRARLREEAEKQPAGWLQWIRSPALAISLALVMVVGITLMHFNGGSPNGSSTGPIATGPIQPGTAVGDLQALDKNQDLYSDFDVLDDLEVQQDVTANP